MAAYPDRVIPASKDCARCKAHKPAHQFSPNRAMRSGLSSYCKACVAAVKQAERRADPEKAAAILRKHYAKHRERRKAGQREYYARNREAIRAKESDPSKLPERREKHNAWRRKRVQSDPSYAQRERDTARAYRQANPEKEREWSRKKYERFKQNPAWVLKRRVSMGLWRALGGKQKDCHWFDLLDYTLDELRQHLERQFLKGMTWENMGEWHIDHIVPMASFAITGPEDPELKRAWALTNLRPLWGKENMSKGAKRLTLL